MEEQVAVIYAGVNGYLDPLPVSSIRSFEEKLLSLLRTKHACDLLEAIRSSNDLSDDSAKTLKSAVESVAKGFEKQGDDVKVSTAKK